MQDAKLYKQDIRTKYKIVYGKKNIYFIFTYGIYTRVKIGLLKCSN